MIKNVTKFTIFDLDGTLCDDRKRKHLVRGDGLHTNDYVEYNDAAIFDRPYPKMKSILDKVVADGGVPLFVTGRSVKWQSDTIRWISYWLGIPKDEIQLIMRPKNDFRPAEFVKRDQLFIYFGAWEPGKYHIGNVYDDNEEVVNMFVEVFHEFIIINGTINLVKEDKIVATY